MFDRYPHLLNVESAVEGYFNNDGNFLETHELGPLSSKCRFASPGEGTPAQNADGITLNFDAIVHLPPDVKFMLEYGRNVAIYDGKKVLGKGTVLHMQRSKKSAKMWIRVNSDRF